MKKTNVLYVLVASHKDIYLEEMWVSIYSLRLYDKDRPITVLCDVDTANYINSYPELSVLITEIVAIKLPEKYNTPKLKSRQLKTLAREYVSGAFLFVDTDTTICGSLDYIDDLAVQCQVPCAVVDSHLPISEMMFPPTSLVSSIFEKDFSDCKNLYNSGVMFVPENELLHEFYKRWNENWHYSTFVKNHSQDQPALLMTNKEFGFVIRDLPDIYDAQIALSMKYFADAIILHWWHIPYIKDQSFNPFMSREVYYELKNEGKINENVDYLIKNVKQSFVSPTTIIGRNQIYFAYTSAFNNFCQIYNEGGVASWLMLKLADWLWKLHKYTKKK